MLSSDTRNSFRQGALELWCPSITIRGVLAGKPVEYRGPGLIRQDKRRQLSFACVQRPPIPMDHLLAAINDPLPVGTLVPDDRYVSLEATDLNGWTWRSDRISIDTDSGLAGSRVSGNVYVLEHEDSTSHTSSSMVMEVLADISLPFNATTEMTIQSAGHERTVSRRNIAQLLVGPFELRFRKEDDSLLVEVSSATDPFPPHFETRIIESLQFMTGRYLSWGLLETACGGVTKTCLRSPDRNHSSQLSAPVDYRRNDIGGRWAWPLFGKYLQHIMVFVGDNRFEMHPLSAWLNYIRGSSAGSIFTRGLALGVAIEGILEAAFPKHGELPARHAEGIKSMLEHVQTWQGDEKLRERTMGAIRAMLKPRAKDRLLDLDANRLVRSADIKAWDTVRNRGAHARPPEREDVQAWIDNCHKAETLLYHLIFGAIGYHGEFTDYSAVNWPQARFPFSTDHLCL